MTLQNLPAELILTIGELTASQADFLALSKADKRLHTILTPRIIPHNIRYHRCAGLTWAVMHNNLRLAKRFLEAGAHPDTQVISKRKIRKIRKTPAKMWGAWKFGNLEKPLYLAAVNGSAEMVRLLLKYGADPRAKSSMGCPDALFVACDAGHWDIVAELLIAVGKQTG